MATADRQKSLTANGEGLRLQRAEDYEGAAAAFTEAIALDPGLIGAYRSRAAAYERLGRDAEAKADLDHVSSVFVSRPQAPTRQEQDVIAPGEDKVSNFLRGLFGWIWE